MSYPLSPARAAVAGVELAKPVKVGSSGYEKIIGTIHFEIDPSDPRNAVIADIDRAPKNASGKVAFSADLYILKPKDAARSNSVALVEIANRGNKGLLSFFNRTELRLDPSTDADLGDRFLIEQGYTLVWVGWQFDVDRSGGRLKADAPLAENVSAVVRSQLVLNEKTNVATLTDLAGYSLDASTRDAALTVKHGGEGEPVSIPREKWKLNGRTLVLDGGYEPGSVYEFTVRANDVPVAGVGLAAVRDTIAWLKYEPGAVAPSKYAYGFGVSQSGRFLRTFLYEGFNSDEKGRQVFDGVLSHIAGNARLSLNERGARPNSGKAPSPGFPFADRATRDPLSGRVDGLLENERARQNQPKVFYTNTSFEYWNADRSAALVHTAPDGKSDLKLLPNVRVYLLSGAQHIPGRFPPMVSTGQQPDNPLDCTLTLRALLTAMDKWVRHATEPAPSRYPTLADGTLVKVSDISFPSIPGVQAPKLIRGSREGTVELPFLVPAVDSDGNERAGITTAEQSVGVATFTGWNFRHPDTGAPNQPAAMIGSVIPFPPKKEMRRGDPRRSIAERYESKSAYLSLAQAHCSALAAQGYLLENDVPRAMQRMGEWWDFATRRESVLPNQQ